MNEPAQWHLLHRRHSEHNAFRKWEINRHRDDALYVQNTPAWILKCRLAATTRRVLDGTQYPPNVALGTTQLGLLLFMLKSRVIAD
uniref:Uncharacterized protein n=1 Tax=Glossina pallidipes TaxID=7398 RepID=A0A1B0A1A2_GLOPL